MELEERMEQLELEMKAMRLDIQKTLVEIRDALPERPSNSSRWQKKAWVLALVNLILAVVLFTNMYLYLPGNMPFDLDPALIGWLRALWLAIAFIWLLLQLYPLALLLEQEDPEWQGVLRRNTNAFVRARPGFLVALTLAVLVIAIVNAVIPAVWLIVALALLVAIGGLAWRNLIDVVRKPSGAQRKG
jgi:hypothetical protein